MKFKKTYLYLVVSWVSVLVAHSCGVGVNFSGTITKVPQTLHVTGFGCDRGYEGHRLIDKSVSRCCIQEHGRQQILHPDLPGDVLSMQCVEGHQVNG